MHSPETLAYFCAQPGRSFWEWESKGGDFADCIDWPEDRKLIVFRHELNGILEAFAYQGLPPLGALLWILDALRHEWNAGEARTRLWNAYSGISGEQKISSAVAELWVKLGPALEKVHGLPADLTASGPARQRLLRTLFESHPDLIDLGISRTILVQFIQTPDVSVFSERPPGLNGIARLLKDLTALEKAFRRCPPEKLEERLRTGLDELPMRPLDLPLPDPDETPAPEPPADLLRALEHEGGELAQVAGLVRRMSAILHVPKAVTHRDELPLGGVSDITNRGDPSRLLMTELAWDDLTFAVRLAQGEALYLRRESPPAEPPPRRLLLIDNGIFLWGKPRLFALGAALALLRQKVGQQSPVGSVFTLVEGRFTPIALETVEDVRAQITRLEPQPHPGIALSLLADSDDSPFKPGEEVFLLTHPAAAETLTTLPIWQQLAHRVPLHTLLLDREGSLELSRHSSAGARLLAKARVEAEDLFEQPKQLAEAKPSPAALTSEFARLPQFYHRKPWPLYIPAPPEPNQVFQIGGKGYVGISTTGAVCWWTTRVHVARLLAPNPPSRQLIGLVVDSESDGRLLMIFGDSGFSVLHILVVVLNGEEDIRQITYQGRLHEVSDLRIQSGALTFIDRGVVKALSLDDGKLIASVNVRQHQGMPWFDGERFLSDGNGSRLPVIKLTAPAVVRPSMKIHRISEISRVGFGVTGGLLVQKEKGRTYTLEVSKTGTLEWSWSMSVKGHLMPLILLDLPEWHESGLSQASFSDGRRIIYDPRGFLHVCDSGEDPHELSLLMVKGKTAAWQRKGFYYGEPSLLWSENAGANSVLTSHAQKLFRPVESAATTRKKGPMP